MFVFSRAIIFIVTVKCTFFSSTDYRSTNWCRYEQIRHSRGAGAWSTNQKYPANLLSQTLDLQSSQVGVSNRLDSEWTVGPLKNMVKGGGQSLQRNQNTAVWKYRTKRASIWSVELIRRLYIKVGAIIIIINCVIKLI